MASPIDKRPLQTIQRWWRTHGHHIIFALALISLSALVAWWAVFIHRAINQEYDSRLAELRTHAQFLAARLGGSMDHEPQPGPVANDERFVILHSPASPSEMTMELRPAWPQYSIQPRESLIAEIESKLQRRRLMIIGEGALLVLLILVSSFMLYRLIREERRSLDELSEFWGRITHEIKTPITGLRAFLETLKRQDFNRDELQPFIELALKQVDRQQQLAHNLLIGQRLRRGAPQLEPQNLNIRSFIDQFVRQQTSLLAGVNLEVNNPSEEDLWITADADALQAILDNLVDNAIKYSSPPPKLSISVSFDDCRVWVLVKDYGIGFPPHQAEHLFDAYRRLKEELPGHSHGTGMGLYISRQLARRMNGDLIASSEGPGQGAEFLLSLPLTPPVAAPQKNS